MRASLRRNGVLRAARKSDGFKRINVTYFCHLQREMGQKTPTDAHVYQQARCSLFLTVNSLNTLSYGTLLWPISNKLQMHCEINI